MGYNMIVASHQCSDMTISYDVAFGKKHEFQVFLTVYSIVSLLSSEVPFSLSLGFAEEMYTLVLEMGPNEKKEEQEDKRKKEENFDLIPKPFFVSA